MCTAGKAKRVSQMMAAGKLLSEKLLTWKTTTAKPSWFFSFLPRPTNAGGRRRNRLGSLDTFIGDIHNTPAGKRRRLVFPSSHFSLNLRFSSSLFDAFRVHSIFSQSVCHCSFRSIVRWLVRSKAFDVVRHATSNEPSVLQKL